MILNITSTKNEKYKFYKSLKQKKVRTESGLYTVEGIKSVCDAIAAKVDIECLLVRKSFYEGEKFNYPDDVLICVINDDIFSPLSDTQNSQGVIAVIKQKKNQEFIPDMKKAYIFCDHLQDPGNLGTIIRTADAAGFGGVLLSEGCVDLHNPKTVRSSMGSFFHINTVENVSIEDIKKYKQAGFMLVCGCLSDNTVDYIKADMKKPVIIVIGNEANGISDEILSLSDIDIKIPIDGKAESLNAAVAAAIIMYEVNRQRRN